MLDEIELSQLAPGDKCVVTKMFKRSSLTKRLAELGIGKGASIDIVRVAPLGDPVEIVVKGYHLSLRKEEAVNIFVKKLTY